MTITTQGKRMSCHLKITTALMLSLTMAVPAAVAQSQAVEEPAPEGDATALMDTVIVTARKREERLQDVPLSVTAFGEAQIEAKKFAVLRT